MLMNGRTHPKLDALRFTANYASSKQLDYGFSELLSSFCPDALRPIRDAILDDDVSAFREEVGRAKKANPDFLDRKMSYWLNFACASGSTNIVRDVLEVGKFELLDSTPLCYAASSGNAELCRVLMNYPASNVDSDVVEFSYLSDNTKLQASLGQLLAQSYAHKSGCYK